MEKVRSGKINIKKILVFLSVLFFAFIAGWWRFFSVEKALDLTFVSKPDLGSSHISEAEFHALVSLHNECFDPDKEKYLSDYLLSLSPPTLAEQQEVQIRQKVRKMVEEGHRSKLTHMRHVRNVTWVRDHRGIVGMYDCRVDSSITHDSVMIFDLCVAKKARGQGIGSRLVQDAIHRCRKPGRDLTLTVYMDNMAAIRMYEKFHFRIIPRVKDPEDMFSMYKKHLMLYQPEH